jgi:hypothetical protein
MVFGPAAVDLQHPPAVAFTLLTCLRGLFVKLLSAASLLLATAIAIPAFAQDEEPRDAVVVDVEGTVQADIGSGLAPAVVDQVLPPASRVLVDTESFTILSFGKECDIRLEPGDWKVPNPSAATVAEIEGGVQIFQVTEFIPIVPNQPVKVKDRILVQSESSAVLRYETGCDVKLDPGIHEVGDGCTCLGPLLASDRPVTPWIGGALIIGAAVATTDRSRPISP